MQNAGGQGQLSAPRHASTPHRKKQNSARVSFDESTTGNDLLRFSTEPHTRENRVSTNDLSTGQPQKFMRALDAELGGVFGQGEVPPSDQVAGNAQVGENQGDQGEEEDSKMQTTLGSLQEGQTVIENKEMADQNTTTF